MPSASKRRRVSTPGSASANLASADLMSADDAGIGNACADSMCVDMAGQQAQRGVCEDSPAKRAYTIATLVPGAQDSEMSAAPVNAAARDPRSERRANRRSEPLNDIAISDESAAEGTQMGRAGVLVAEEEPSISAGALSVLSVSDDDVVALREVLTVEDTDDSDETSGGEGYTSEEGHSDEYGEDYDTDAELSDGNVFVAHGHSWIHTHGRYPPDDDPDVRLARLLQQQELALAAAAGMLPPEYDGDIATADEDTDADPVAEMSYEALIELEDAIGDARQRGLDDAAISCLARVSYTDAAVSPGHSECVVCMNAFCPSERTDVDVTELALVRLRCTHIFHADCASSWLRVRSTCPICRESAL